MDDCTHTVSQGRAGAKSGQSWCVECGEQVLDVEVRPCRECNHFFSSVGYNGCRKHLMAVSPSMHATFFIAKGTCFWESEE